MHLNKGINVGIVREIIREVFERLVEKVWIFWKNIPKRGFFTVVQIF